MISQQGLAMLQLAQTIDGGGGVALVFLGLW